MVGSSGTAADLPPADGEGLARLRARVRGRVQGVGFRYFTKREAELLGLHGHVRNCADGSVEVIAEETMPLLDLLLVRLRAGSRTAYVERIDVEWQPATEEYERFDLRF